MSSRTTPEYRAFSLERTAGQEELAAAAAPAIAIALPALRAWLAPLLESGGPRRGILRAADGRSRHVTAVLLGDGTARRHLLLALRDPADPALLDASAEAERLDATARAGGALGHAVNNALTAILGNADHLVELAPGLPEQAGEAASLLLAAAERLEALMRRVSRLSRAVRPPEGACEPGVVLRELVARRRPDLPPGIRLEFAQGPQLGTLLVEPQFLASVLDEAIANSVVALGAAGRIRIAAIHAPGACWPGFRWLSIAVRDDGPGFPEPWLAASGGRFLAPAAQVGGSVHPMGLAILRGFAQAMGGTLTLGNQPEGGGRVVLQLPVLEASAGP